MSDLHEGLEKLEPCPFCGWEAKFGVVTDDPELSQSGGEYIECTNPQCQATTCLMFPIKEDVKSLLAERWNRRALLAAGAEGPGLRDAFVQGAKWWEFESTGRTMWQSDQQKAWDEAERKAKNGSLGILDPLASRPVEAKAETGEPWGGLWRCETCGRSGNPDWYEMAKGDSHHTKNGNCAGRLVHVERRSHPVPAANADGGLWEALVAIRYICEEMGGEPPEAELSDAIDSIDSIAENVLAARPVEAKAETGEPRLEKCLPDGDYHLIIKDNMLVSLRPAPAASAEGLRVRIEAIEAWELRNDGHLCTGPTTKKEWISRDKVLAALRGEEGEETGNGRSVKAAI